MPCRTAGKCFCGLAQGGKSVFWFPGGYNHVNPDGVGTGGAFDVSWTGEFGRDPDFIPRVVTRITVGERVPVRAVRLDRPAVRPEIGLGQKNDFSVELIPVILFILRHGREASEDLSGRFMVSELEMRRTEFAPLEKFFRNLLLVL